MNRERHSTKGNVKPHHVYGEMQLVFFNTRIPNSNGKVVRNEDGEIMWDHIMRGVECHTTIIGLHREGYGKLLNGK